MITAVFRDAFKNRRELDLTRGAAYNGGAVVNLYRIKIFDNKRYLYHCSVYDSEQARRESLENISAGTFKELIKI